MLTTPRLRLRPFTERDVDALHSVLLGDGALEYFPGNPKPTRELAIRLTKSIVDHWEERGFGLWAVEDLESGNFLGRCGLQFLPETDETEVDFVFDRAVWNRGYATEAALASLNYGFETLEVSEIVGLVHPDNRASRRVLEKIGMDHTGTYEYFGMTVERYALRR